MNYAKIYSDFIADRKGKEHLLASSGNYFESHHILPKSLGGSNDAGNLVKLTPEDHIRAHVIFAKAHGGNMWAPVNVMVSEYNVEFKKIPTRRVVKLAALARQKHGQAMRGNGNPFFGKKHTEATIAKISDGRVHMLKHADGSQVGGNQRELIKLTGLGARNVSRLVNGERNVCKGWFCPSINPTLLSKKDRLRTAWRANQGQITLYHKSGIVWTGFPVDAPIKVSDFHARNTHCQGWFRSKKERDSYEMTRALRAKSAAEKRGDISGLNNPRADKSKYKWKHTETGEIMVKTRVSAWKYGPLTKSGVASVLSGRQKQTGGWLFMGVAG